MTRKFSQTTILLLFAILMVMISLSACAEGPVGIFAGIALETDIGANRTADFEGSSPDYIGMFGGNYYTIVNGTIWTRAVASPPWDRMDLQSGPTQGAASAAAVAGSNLYVVSGKIGDSTQKIWTKTNVTSWTEPVPGFSENGRLDSLLSANGQLFVVTRTDTLVDSVTDTKYSVYYLSGGSFLSAGLEMEAIDGHPDSIAFDSDATSYWLVAGSKIYTGTPGSISLLAGIPADDFSGIVQESPGTMILSSSTGKLHKYDGSTWTVSSVFKKNDLHYAFSSPITVDDGTNIYLLAGTDYADGSASASGYLEFDVTSGFNPLNATASVGSDFATVVNFQTSVSTDYIHSLGVFDVGAGELRVFALTMGDGLWSKQFTDSSWSGWARE